MINSFLMNWETIWSFFWSISAFKIRNQWMQRCFFFFFFFYVVLQFIKYSINAKNISVFVQKRRQHEITFALKLVVKIQFISLERIKFLAGLFEQHFFVRSLYPVFICLDGYCSALGALGPSPISNKTRDVIDGFI